VVVNVRNAGERERGERLIADFVRLRKVETLFSDILGPLGSRVPITAVVANLADHRRPGAHESSGTGSALASAERLVGAPPREAMAPAVHRADCATRRLEGVDPSIVVAMVGPPPGDGIGIGRGFRPSWGSRAPRSPDVLREEIVDEGLVAKPAPLGLPPHGVQHLGIDPNGDQSPGGRTQGGPPHPAHRSELCGRSLRDVGEVNRGTPRTPRAPCGSPAAH
jgi:hypothetical protein